MSWFVEDHRRGRPSVHHGITASATARPRDGEQVPAVIWSLHPPGSCVPATCTCPRCLAERRHGASLEGRLGQPVLEVAT